MDQPPDFDALRAKRNAGVMEVLRKLAEEDGVSVETLAVSFNQDACYCACASGGPCEHQWDGEDWEDDDSGSWSATCSRCGAIALFHDMRCAP